MSVSHPDLTKNAELNYQQKNRLDYVSETTSFHLRNRPVTVASP